MSSQSDSATRSDVVVIGSGPGGYVAAIRLGQLGRNVILIEKKKLGGVCVNEGCIPSKALITAGRLVKNTKNASKMGIDAEVNVDLARLQTWKQGVVDRLASGILQLCKANRVQLVYGEAEFVSKNTLKVSTSSEMRTIDFSHAIIATGASPLSVPGINMDGKRVFTSTEALCLSEIPQRMMIVGGGVIGLEIGMAYANLFGTELTIVEMMDQLLPGIDPELVVFVNRSLEKLNAKIYLKSKVRSTSTSGGGVEVTFETEGKEEKTVVDCVLVSIGRKPNSSGLGLESIGVTVNQKGFVEVDGHLRTNVENIFAIGDVIGGPLLAHKASREGIVAAETICGNEISYDSSNVPSAIFTDPEIAVVGLTATQAAQRNLTTATGKFPFLANGKALASNEADGFAKIIADEETKKVIGVELVGAESSDLIGEAALAIEVGASLEDIASTIHPHPTLPEALMEAAESALGKAVHIQNRTRDK